jgi:hypothetical protein
MHCFLNFSFVLFFLTYHHFLYQVALNPRLGSAIVIASFLYTALICMRKNNFLPRFTTCWFGVFPNSSAGLMQGPTLI